MSLEFGRKWGKECLNNRFSMPTLQCAGYSVKPIYFNYLFCYLVERQNVYTALNSNTGAVVAKWLKRLTVDAKVVDSKLIWRNKIFNIFISSFWKWNHASIIRRKVAERKYLIGARMSEY